MADLSLLEVVYVVIVYSAGGAVEGWATTTFAVTLGFLGIFVILSFVLKYLMLILRAQFTRQSYLTEGQRKVGKS